MEATCNAAKRRIRDALSTPRPDTFSAWPQRNPEYQRRLGWVLLGWTIVLVGAGVIAGMISWR